MLKQTNIFSASFRWSVLPSLRELQAEITFPEIQILDLLYRQHQEKFRKFISEGFVFLTSLSVRQFSCSVMSLAKSDPMDCSTLGFSVHHYSRSLLKLMSLKTVMPSNHLMLCHLLLLLPSIFPSIRVFSNECIYRIRWPKYCSFSYSISPSNEY